MRIPSIVLLAALLHTGGALADLLPVTEKGIALLNQGRALDNERKFAEAMENFRAAALADPKASAPLSSMANLYYRLAVGQADQKEVARLRELATTAAHAALKVDQRDTTAMETLRLLADGTEQAQYQPTPEAKKAVHEGEILFYERKYAAAAEKYALASQLDPGYAEAILYEGDCYFMLDDMPGAESKFRQSLQINPLEGAGWRFLFDALIRQGKTEDAQLAALSAIAALPSAKPSWSRMAQISEQAGRTLTAFVLTPRASFKDSTVTYDPANGPDGDGAVWLTYGMAQARESIKKAPAAPFARKLAAWQTTLAVMQDLGAAKVKDQGLQDMLRFQKGGQLQAAIFLLQYQEDFRPEFEAWKKADPDAIRRFIDTFRVRL
jgi:tetratricopeptide (TPR) repeat protein